MTLRRDRFQFYVRGYYADDVQPPKRPGELAIEVGCDNESVRDMELAVLEEREDIGRSEWF